VVIKLIIAGMKITFTKASNFLYPSSQAPLPGRTGIVNSVWEGFIMVLEIGEKLFIISRRLLGNG
jgi:hypothetical protein